VIAEGIPHFSENAYMFVIVKAGLLFHSDDGGGKFFPYIGDILPNYTALQRRRYYSSSSSFFFAFMALQFSLILP
jgi:hypothetical protein